MKRRALIIYCDDTGSGKLPGPPHDNANFRNYLMSSLGGEWKTEEIRSLHNPKKDDVKNVLSHFLNGADYTFIIFTGHGFINVDKSNQQYIELKDGDISINNLRTDASRQTMIIDACRGSISPMQELMKAITESRKFFSLGGSTRELFDKAVRQAEEGLSILYASSENQTALDTSEGAAYLLSLIRAAKQWKGNNKTDEILRLNIAHELAKEYLADNFQTIQEPTINTEKRRVYFPFAVKFKMIYG